MRACDSETTGLSPHHGCRPFFISGCDHNGNTFFKRWDVDPFTRVPIIPKGDVVEVSDYLNEDKEGVCFQNIKFDLHMLRYIGVKLPPWKKLHDTLTMMHHLDQIEPHDLKGMAAKYFDFPLDDEERLKQDVSKAKRIAKKLGWAVAHPDHPHFAPANGDSKKCGIEPDYWLLHAVAKYDMEQEAKLGKRWKPLLSSEERSSWIERLPRYAINDAKRTMLIFLMAKEQLQKQNLWKPYLLNRSALSVMFSMEKKGFHVKRDILDSEIKRISTKAQEELQSAERIAKKSLDVPSFNVGSPIQLQKLLYQTWNLPALKTTKTGISTDFDTLMKLTFEEEGIPTKAKRFLMHLMTGRKFEKAAKAEMAFRACLVGSRIHANIKNVGTKTTRVSITDPGLQTAAKDREMSEDENEARKEFLDSLYHGELNPRVVFGPPPGFMWYAIDYNQLQLRIFAAISGEEKLQQAFRDGWKAHDFMAHEIFTRRKELKVGEKPNKQQKRVGKCFHPDTEVLTPSGWKPISQLSNGEKVAQAIPKSVGNVQLEWVVPTSVFSMPNDRPHLIHLRNEGIDLRVTDNHRMFGWTQKKKPKDYIPLDLNKARYWENAGVMVGEKVVDETLLRLAVATQADGSYNGGIIRFGFMKRRKIDRLHYLLKKAGIKYRNRISSQGATEFVIKTIDSEPIRKLLTSNKQLSYWWIHLTLELREAVLDEARYWDSAAASKRVGYTYLSHVPHNIDVLQAIAAITGNKSRIGITGRTLSIKNHSQTRGGNLKPKKVRYTKDVWCLSVPSTYVLVRDGGTPVITGQSVNFGYVFGASEDKINRTAGVEGLFGIVNKMFPNAHQLMKDTKEEVKKNKCVWTGGWRIACELPHKGVNYKVQGLEGIIVKRAMVACHRYLLSQKTAGFLSLQIHDELVFELPMPKGLNKKPNLTIEDCPHLDIICSLMEAAGLHYGVETPVSPSVVFTSWNKAIEISR